MSELISVLYVEPKNEDYTVEEIEATYPAVNNLLGKTSNYAEIGNGIGLFVVQVLPEDDTPPENFTIVKNAEVVQVIGGPVVFARVEDGKHIKGLSDAEMEVIARNLLETQSGQRILFLDVITQELVEAFK